MDCRVAVQEESKQFYRSSVIKTEQLAGLVLLVFIAVAAIQPLLGFAAEPAPAVEEWLNQNVRLHDTVQAVDRPSPDGKPSGEIRAGAEVKAIGYVADKRWVQIIMYPGLQLQRLTTREPDRSELEVAIAALRAVLTREVPGQLAPDDMLGLEVVA